ncbi:Electron transport complex subunit D [Halomicronema hongdechloris C2206]|uniref:Electron transport complex subunit D n=1 Tax=Halomicronema hongdechloris C2206 TaxID=1641165 RepID=A0A1Z3HSE2_9CYAN|nr:RnfABCDGE type electron transport complex subunit D [Halomicronema hongdechloris]ASC73047.1 Electron transport complex subunit D [Halomicronema hongdechloris C2206]
MLRDARDYQIGFLALFLILGVATRDWTLRPEVVGSAIATCLASQVILQQLVDNRPSWITMIGGREARGLGSWGANWSANCRHSDFETRQRLLPLSPVSLNWRSPLITALGLSLLLRVEHPGTMVLVSALAIASKFVIQSEGKHLFNPANFGIIAGLLLTQDAWVSPGQWGDEVWYALIFLGAGGLVLKRVGRWDTTVAFLGAYAGLEALRNLWLGWAWDVWSHRLMSGSLLLFALFMVTDPRSIPNARPARLLWAMAIALLTFVLRNYAYLPTAVFWAYLPWLP